MFVTSPNVSNKYHKILDESGILWYYKDIVEAIT